MKHLTKVSIWVLFFALMAGNMYVFVSGVALSNEISTFETQIEELRSENRKLEKEVLMTESMDFAASLAGELAFTDKAEPVFFENDTKYAYNN